MDETIMDVVTDMVEKNWPGLGRGTLRILRERFPGVVFVAVAASDVMEEPVRRSKSVELHFINTADHCVSVVSDPKAAGGIMLAVKE